METEQPVVPQQNPSMKTRMKAYGKVAFDFLKIVLLALVIVLPIRYFLFQPFIVQGDSMDPNFASGDYLIVDEISYRLGTPQRGDVMVFSYPKDTTEKFIKRVIGLPGETVTVTSGKVEITSDGKTFTLDETYLPVNLQTYGDTKITLTSGQYFVMGDNRPESYDSRIWGPVPSNDIIGKPVLRLWPLNAIGEIVRGDIIKK
jgi:signal peptidase I